MPKCGGTSLTNWLAGAGLAAPADLAARLHDPREYGALARTPVATFGHISVDALIDRSVVTAQQVDLAWSFTVVRNPYSRAVSLYEYSRRIGFIPADTTLVGFLRELVRHTPPIGPYQSIGLSYANPQVRWIRQSRWAGPRHVFRLEDIEPLVAELVSRRPELRDGPGRLNVSAAGGVHAAPYEAVPLIRELFVEDFLEFGYSFDQGHAADVRWVGPDETSG